MLSLLHKIKVFFGYFSILVEIRKYGLTIIMQVIQSCIFIGINDSETQMTSFQRCFRQTIHGSTSVDHLTCDYQHWCIDKTTLIPPLSFQTVSTPINRSHEQRGVCTIDTFNRDD